MRHDAIDVFKTGIYAITPDINDSDRLVFMV